MTKEEIIDIALRTYCANEDVLQFFKKNLLILWKDDIEKEKLALERDKFEYEKEQKRIDANCSLISRFGGLV